MKKQKVVKKQIVSIDEYLKQMNKIIIKENSSPMPEVFIAMLDYAASVKIK